MNVFENISVKSSILFVIVSLVISVADAGFDVEVTNVTSTSVKLSWLPYLATDSNGYVVSYKVRSLAEDATTAAVATTGASKFISGVTTTHYTLPLLSPSTQYEFTVSPATTVGGSTKVGPTMAPAVIATTKHVECNGTNMAMKMPSNRSLHYQNLRDRYTNCTYVNGNLEVTWLQGEDLDFSFLRHIREITGYALFAHINVSKIVLPRLKVIWGRNQSMITYSTIIKQKFSLLIVSTKIKSIELPGLRAVIAGNVGAINNSDLCYFNTVNWDDIIDNGNFKWELYLSHYFRKEGCPPCDELCTVKSCWGAGFHNCQKFSKINCSHECDQRRCFELGSEGCCHPICAGDCTGPKTTDCLLCLHSYKDGVCIEEYPRKTHISLSVSNTIERMTSKLLYCAIVTVILLNIAGVLLIIWYRRKRIQFNKKAVNMVMELTGIEDNSSLRLSNVPPNTAKLRIIKEVDLRIGAELGNGAFGVVYRGIWIVEDFKTIKIPVAIKKLQHKKNDAHGYENSSKEFLDEAYLMARVEHKNLVKLLAVCMASEPMLVTELMPLGCLLNYVQNNKNKIGSKSFIKWSTQIAKGMAYLEENRLVHRDLAARNILLQNIGNVKITDFGLARLLDIDQQEYTINNGKMPVKWLAPECLKYGVFTHKSDVWAFGVTVWELLTYGKQPYGNVVKTEMLSLLERGERLPQPPICTIDVYMVMVRCWLTEKDGRPSFKKLAYEFDKMSIDPGRYLVIPGDRFMRLPSSTSRDDTEMLSNLANGGATMKNIMVTKEYMNPKMENSKPVPTVLRSNSTVHVTYIQHKTALPSAECDSFGGVCNESKPQVCTLESDTHVNGDDYLLPYSTNRELYKKRRHSIPNHIQSINNQYGALKERRTSHELLMSPSLDFDHKLKSTLTQLRALDNPEYHLKGNEPSAVVADVSCKQYEEGVDISNVLQSVGSSTLHQDLNKREKSDLEPRT